MSTKSIYLLLVGFIVISLSACYDRKEGCLEVQAANYDTFADDPCDDCCTYPSLSLAVSHQWGEEAIRWKDTLITDMGDSIIILGQKLYLSNFDLGDDVQMNDSITFSVTDGDEVTMVDDIVLLNDNAVSIGVTSFIYEGDVDDFSFLLGVDDVLDDVVLTDEQVSSPLGASNAIVKEGKYSTLRLTCVRGVGLKDTVSYDVQEDFSKTITLDSPAFVERGQSVSVSIRFDYSALVSKVPFSSGDQQEIEAQLTTNLVGAIY